MSTYTDPVAERMIDEISGPRTEIGRQLEDLADRQVELRVSLRAEFEGDPDSAGHVIHGYITEDTDDLVITLDDRCDNLPGDLAAELRRIAQRYLDLAGQVEHNAGIG